MAVGALAELLARHAAALHALPRVVGVAEGRDPRGRPCVLLLLSALPDDPSVHPTELEGVPVVLRVTEPPEARGQAGGRV